MFPPRLGALAAAAALVVVASARAQSPAASWAGAKSPDALATEVMRRFASGTPEEFAAAFPDSSQVALVRAAAQQGAVRVVNARRVLWSGGGHAVLLLSGSVRLAATPQGASPATGRGAAAGAPRGFAGVYEAVESAGSWRLTRDWPIDTMNAVHAHHIQATLVPGTRLDVIDTIAVAIGAPYGLIAHLNGGATIKEVRIDGRPAAHSFDHGAGAAAGVLWVASPVRASETLVLEYGVPEERRPAGRGGAPGVVLAGAPAADLAPPYGQYFNTSGWHAYLDINGSHDRALFDVTVHAPAAYELTTSLPQTDTVVGGARIVHGSSRHPQFLVSLIYDRYWRPRRTRVGDLTVETFFRPDARIAHDTAVAAFARVDSILTARFGPPNTPPYLAVVESFGYGATSGCGQRQADLVMCGGGVNDSTTHPTLGNPSYTWAHETSHAWTMNADGPAATMLREGWATYAEGASLAAEHPELASAFWERTRNGIMLGTEGHQSLIPPGPTGGYYSKGAWLLHMLEYQLGGSAFDRAIRAYCQLQFDAKPAGYPELIAAMSAAAGYDMTSFAMPWLTGKFMPDLEGQVTGSKLVVSQRQPETTYDLPKLDVDLVTAQGSVRRAIHVTKTVDTVDVGDIGPVTAVKFDPDHHFLMQRHWGEVVRFELPASKAPGAKTVALTGQISFSLTPIPATREGDEWVVVLPLSEGRYPWRWEIDGGGRDRGAAAAAESQDPSMAGVREVKPLQLIGPYPR